MPISLLRAALARQSFKLKDSVKLVLGCLLHPGPARRWLGFVAQRPAMVEGVRLHPHLLNKVYRPYLSTRLSVAQRADVLINHYNTVQALGLETLAQRAMHEPQLLFEGRTKSDELFALHLCAAFDGHREGEWCLRLSFKGEILFVLNLDLQQDDAGLRMIVGRLQGSASEQARELVRLATREFHACRPATLLVTAARQLAQVLGCFEVLLVSNRDRIALNPWRRWHISSDYDQTWIEMGARPGENGFFVIEPQGLQEVDFTAIASKKRSEAKKKAALLDEIYAGLQQRFGSSSRSFT